MPGLRRRQALAGVRSCGPYDEDWYETGSSEFHFTTYMRDSESGNDYAMHRFYVSRLGGFSGLDPLRGKLANPQLSNRYSYTANDPVDYTDPSGREVLGFCTNIFGCIIDGCFDFGSCPVDLDGDAFVDLIEQLVEDYIAGQLFADVQRELVHPEGCSEDFSKFLDCQNCCNNANAAHEAICAALFLIPDIGPELATACIEESIKWLGDCKNCCDQVFFEHHPCMLFELPSHQFRSCRARVHL